MFITSIVTEQCIVVKVTHEKSTTSAPAPLWRRAVAEFLGAGLLVTVVVGSGIAAQRLSQATLACNYWRTQAPRRSGSRCSY